MENEDEVQEAGESGVRWAKAGGGGKRRMGEVEGAKHLDTWPPAVNQFPPGA